MGFHHEPVLSDEPGDIRLRMIGAPHQHVARFIDRSTAIPRGILRPEFGVLRIHGNPVSMAEAPNLFRLHGQRKRQADILAIDPRICSL